jgi:hypothetical protein
VIYAMPFLWAPAAMVLYNAVLFPALSFSLPLWAAIRGVNPYGSFFPPLVFYAIGIIIIRFAPPAWVFPVCFILSILGASIGQQLYRRQNSRRNHG